jgi:hypothetical protein
MIGFVKFFSNVRGRDLAGLLRFFATEGVGDRSGVIAPVFALMVLPIVVLAAGTMEMAGWSNARQKTIAALDAGLLAGGRVLMLRGSEKEAISAAKGVYEENVKTRSGAVSDKITFNKVGSDAFAVAGNVHYQTKLLSLIGISELPLLKEDGSENPRSQFSVLNTLEVSLVLDVSGSMLEPAGKDGVLKIDAMKTAATRLASALLEPGGSTSASLVKVPTRVALVPFSQGVRPPEFLYDAVRNPAVKGPYNRQSTRLSDSVPKSQWWFVYTNLFFPYPCVVERSGPERYTDAVAGPGAYSTPLLNNADTTHRPYSQGFENFSPRLNTQWYCPGEDMAVLPLTSDVDQVTSVISKLDYIGGTAGHVGVAWGWYMLSPKWAPLLKGAEPADYEATARKAVVFLTDGQNNPVGFSIYGIPAYNQSTYPKPTASANGATPDQQQLAICENMKKENIQIFTVGFAVAKLPAALNMLKACATSPSHFYQADDAEALYQAFDSIKNQLLLLYLVR